MQQWRIPAQHYAVFRHDAHVSAIGQTYSAIFNEWLPAHGRRAADGPTIERHREGFDPRTGLGGVDIWIPLEAAGR
jgi:AraC family transcriptional regulator